MMFSSMLRRCAASLLVCASVSGSVVAQAEADQAALSAVLAMPQRGDTALRDEFRHPLQTLDFFEVAPDHSVVEIWPGGGWYSLVLAPYLKDDGSYYAAHFDPQSPVGFFKRSRRAFEGKMDDLPEVYGNTRLTVFNPVGEQAMAPAGSVDRVLTFRNVHNWYMNGGEAAVVAAFEQMFEVLKPGGMMGVVDHRLPENRPLAEQKTSGYMKQSFVIEAAETAGFKLVASSNINANPQDSADHPNGVWTLPPTNRNDGLDADHYRGIGESDRMTLKFIKPGLQLGQADGPDLQG